MKQYDQSRLLIPVRGEAILSYKFASNIIVSEKNKLVFCPIPKAANSNWKYLIRKFEGIPDYADLTTAHNPNMSGLRYLSDYSASEAQEILCSPTFFKFVFVRNPYMRLLSCYMDKFRNTDPKYVYSEYRSFLAQLFNWRYARTVNLSVDPRPTFNAFIDELTKHEPADMNAHWMPQTIHCGIGVTPYDFIGHMEHVDVDAKRVLQKLGKQHEHFPSQQEIGFPSSGASNFVADKLYTKQLKVKVRALYDADFHILGYD